MANEIEETLGIAPLRASDDNTQIITVPENEDDDDEFARQHLYRIIENAEKTYKEMFDLAVAAEHPRAFEVVKQLIDAQLSANKELRDMSEKRKKKNQEGPKTVNNNLFVGSTKEILERLTREDDESS